MEPEHSVCYLKKVHVYALLQEWVEHFLEWNTKQHIIQTMFIC